MTSLGQFTCLNPHCPDHQKPEQGNITLYTFYSRKRVRLLLCRTCGKTFSELKGTPFWGTRLDWNTIVIIYRGLLSGGTIRGTARDYNFSKNTIKRYLDLLNDNFPAVEKLLIDQQVILPGQQQMLLDLKKRFPRTVKLAGKKAH